MKKEIVALIVAYNEELYIANVIAKLKKYLQKMVVIDDGSTDKTAEIVRRQKVSLVRLAENQGKGKALLIGLKYVLNEYKDTRIVVILDGDGQHDPDDLTGLLKTFSDKRPDLLIGSRINWRPQMPILRMIWNVFISYIISEKINLRLPDTQSGFRLIDAAFLKKIISLLGQHRYNIETELIFVARNKGAKIATHPIKTVYLKSALSHNLIDDIRRSFEIFKYVIFE